MSNSSITVQVTDSVKINPVRRTRDGYLVASCRIARTGVQEYRAGEFGLKDRKPTDIIRVYRPEEEVFHRDAANSFGHIPLTYNHPTEMVDSKNYRKYAVGKVDGEVMRDGDFMRVNLLLMDEDTIKLVESGAAKELSAGYGAELDFVDGVTPSGEQYDAIQRGIRANHLAIVPVARGGSHLRIGDGRDESTGDSHMNDKTTTLVLDGIPVTMDVRDAAIAQAHIRKLEGVNAAQALQIKDSIADLEKAREEEAKRKRELETKDGEIVALKKQVEDAQKLNSPDVLDAAINERLDVVDAARVVLGDKLVIDGKSIADIRKQTVEFALGDAAKNMSEDAISGAFAIATKDAKPASSGARQVRDAIANGRTNPSRQIGDSRQSAWEKRGAEMRDAWKTPNASRA